MNMQVWQYITLTKRIYLIDCPGIVPTSAKDSQTSTVLKGVVRIEALATPSEHIPALMERVKPIYLSRTYDIPLPDPDDPSRGWDAETFLDKLARMKGRLLKGGEPDLDSVAKIVLSDWVRGRIPFFVPPPERPEELNQAEEKAKAANKKAADAKGKAKAEEVEDGAQPKLVPVKQNLGSIMQKNTFVAEDIRPLEEADMGAEGEESGLEESGGGDSDEASSAAEDAEEEPELAWNDVFNGDDVEVEPEEVESLTVFSKQDTQSEDEDGTYNTFTQDQPLKFAPAAESNDEEADATSTLGEAPKKEPRMKTNKVRCVLFMLVHAYRQALG